MWILLLVITMDGYNNEDMKFYGSKGCGELMVVFFFNPFASQQFFLMFSSFQLLIF